MNSQLFNVNRIDEESEFVMDQFREGYNTIEIKSVLKNFIEARVQQSFTLISNSDYKSAYFVYRKLEKVIIVSLKHFGVHEEILTGYKEIMLLLLDEMQLENRELNKQSLLKVAIETQIYDQSEPNELYYFLLRQLVQTISNIGVILMLRNKVPQSQQQFIRGLLVRSYILENNLSLYQMAILFGNLAFTYKQLAGSEADVNASNYIVDASQFLNKSILSLENLSSPDNSTQEISVNYKLMLILIECYYSRKEERLLPEAREIQRERMIHLLAMNYRYYSDILQQENKIEQSKFCLEQFQHLSDLFYKLNPRAIIPSQSKKLIKQVKIPEEEVQISKHLADQAQQSQKLDNFSSVTVKSVNTGTTVNNPMEISKDKIIFQKYMQTQMICQFNKIVEIQSNCFAI